MKLFKFYSRGIAFFIFISVVNPCYSTSELAWKLRHSEKGINLHTREVDGSDYLEIKAHVIFNTSFTNLLAQFANDDKCWKWIKNCLRVKLLQQVSNDEKIFYSVLNMPWPLTERDFLFRSIRKIETQKGLATIELRPVSRIYYTTEYVRAKSTITYRLESLSATSSSLSILMHTEFGGTTPVSLINSKFVYYFLSDIKALVKSLNENNLASTIVNIERD